MAEAKKKIYTVSEVNGLVKKALEEGLPSMMTVSGEVSDWKRHGGSGHCYFSLKDKGGVLSCVMWASKSKKLKFAPENGMAVLVRGHVDVYQPQGKYQFYVEKIEPAGVGSLQLAFEQMRMRLEAEGLFKEDHKKAIPAYPMRIGMVTSESGAAVKDIAESVYNRWPCAKMFIYPVAVQGKGAAKRMAGAIRDINRRNKKLCLDVLIVGRGGGSLEDLWAFNEEVVARAIYDSKVPVISAVGHEVDVTISDLVADARASTPTKAGVIAVPDIREVVQRLGDSEKRLRMSVSGEFRYCVQSLETVLASSVFRDSYSIVAGAGQRLDEASVRLGGTAGEFFGRLRERVGGLGEQVMRIEPHRVVGRKKVELAGVSNDISRMVCDVAAKKKLQLTALENKLGAMDPRGVLKRGYSITRSKRTGGVISCGGDVEVGDTIVTELAADRIESEVKAKGRGQNG